MHACTCARVNAHISACVQACMRACGHACMRASVRACMSTIKLAWAHFSLEVCPNEVWRLDKTRLGTLQREALGHTSGCSVPKAGWLKRAQARMLKTHTRSGTRQRMMKWDGLRANGSGARGMIAPLARPPYVPPLVLLVQHQVPSKREVEQEEFRLSKEPVGSAANFGDRGSRNWARAVCQCAC